MGLGGKKKGGKGLLINADLKKDIRSNLIQD